MTIETHPHTGRFLMGRLRHAMTAREMDLLEGLVERTENFDGERLLVERGDFCDFSTVLIDGFMLRTIREGDARSVVGFQVAGDFVDLHAFALKRLDHDLVTIGRGTLGIVPHERLQQVMRDEPHLARLFWFATLLDAAIHREWIHKHTQLRAMGRVAHVLAELWYRLRMIGKGNSKGFQTPLKQIDLAQMCGISVIHTSRSLTALKDAGCAEFRRGLVIILDGEKLKKVARFDPTYLYGEGMLRVEHALDEGAVR